MKVSTITFSIYCLLILASWVLLYLTPESYVYLTSRNGVVEILTSLLLLLAGFRLIFFNWDKGKMILPRILGAILIIGAFEELNWGKHYFNWSFRTIVDYIGRISVEYILDTFLLFLVAIMSILFVLRKRNFFDFRIPDFSLLLMFLISAFYRPYDSILGFYLLLLIPLAILFYAAFHQQKKNAIVKCFLALLMIIGTFLINSTLVELSQIPVHHIAHFKELLFSFITLAYSIFMVKEEVLPEPFEMESKD